MLRVKQSSVAGLFYPNNADELLSQLEGFRNQQEYLYPYRTRAIIVPHAGLIYSGQLAYAGISHLDANVENIFIFGPAHKVAFKGVALSSFDAWQTPLGTININKQIYQELEALFNARVNDQAFEEEHSIEVEIPFLQTLLVKHGNLTIIPILIGDEDPSKIANILKHYYNHPKNAFIISSDLSHFLPDAEAQKVDQNTANIIENNEYDNLAPDMACGSIGIAGLMQFAESNKYSLIRINMFNSSATSFDKTSVVGYGAWFLYEGEKNDFIKNNYSKLLINICKNTLSQLLNDKSNKLLAQERLPVLHQLGACFITLEKKHQLRGCIGSIIAHRPLIKDLIEHTKNAACNDTRFAPVRTEELTDIKLSISLLSTPQQIHFLDENDLLDQIIKDKDGIIIQDKKASAVYLPVVWKQLPDKKEFLNSLKIKAGLSEDHFSKTFTAYRFYTTYIKEP